MLTEVAEEEDEQEDVRMGRGCGGSSVDVYEDDLCLVSEFNF